MFRRGFLCTAWSAQGELTGRGAGVPGGGGGAGMLLKRLARAAPGARGSLGPPGCLVHLEPVARMAFVALLSDMLRLPRLLLMCWEGGWE